MQVRTLRDGGRVHFGHWTDDDNAALGMCVGQGGDKFIIHPLVHYTKESKHRTRQVRHVIGHLRTLCTGFAEMLDVHTAAIRMRVGIVLDFIAPDLRATGKNHVRNSEQFALAADHLSRSALELGQLIHAIEHDGLLVHVSGERRYCHRIIKPLDRVTKT